MIDEPWYELMITELVEKCDSSSGSLKVKV